MTAAEVTATYENATVPFADQYGSQTNLLTGIDSTLATAAANTAAFNAAAYTWASNASTSTVVASNVLSMTSNASGGIFKAVSKNDKNVQFTFNVTAITGTWRWLGAENVDITTTGIKYLTAKQTDDYVRFYSNSAGATISIDATSTNLELVATGCVADYDLAFAQPEISTMVQDRAGAADGTSSATGVKQVTPIEQLNSKSARIGTSAATPADGDLLVSGNVGIGGAPVSLSGLTRFLHIADAATPGIVLDDTNSTQWEAYNNGGKLYFSHNGATTPLSLDGPTGLATFSNGIAFQSATTGTGTGTGYTLDSYEVGTFTPVDSSGASLAFTSASGFYTKIGSLVTFRCTFTFPTTTDTSNVLIGGLPFSVDADTGGATIGYTPAASSAVAYTTIAATNIYLLRPGVNTTNANMSTQSIVIYGTYNA